MNKEKIMTYSFDENTVSDLHKDAYGFRPGESFWSKWKSSTDDQKEKIWSSLIRELDYSMEQEKLAYEKAVAEFEAQVKMNMSFGAKSREQAIKWIVDALDMKECHDAGYVCYTLGIPYNMSKEFEPFVRG